MACWLTGGELASAYDADVATPDRELPWAVVSSQDFIPIGGRDGRRGLRRGELASARDADVATPDWESPWAKLCAQ